MRAATAPSTREREWAGPPAIKKKSKNSGLVLSSNSFRLFFMRLPARDFICHQPLYIQWMKMRPAGVNTRRCNSTTYCVYRAPSLSLRLWWFPFTNCLLSFHVSTAATTRGDVIVFSYSAPGCCWNSTGTKRWRLGAWLGIRRRRNRLTRLLLLGTWRFVSWIRSRRHQSKRRGRRRLLSWNSIQSNCRCCTEIAGIESAGGGWGKLFALIKNIFKTIECSSLSVWRRNNPKIERLLSFVSLFRRHRRRLFFSIGSK